MSPARAIRLKAVVIDLRQPLAIAWAVAILAHAARRRSHWLLIGLGSCSRVWWLLGVCPDASAGAAVRTSCVRSIGHAAAEFERGSHE
jgi:hypothetical protein